MSNLNPVEKEKRIHLIFIWSVFLKALNGILEIIGGILFLFHGATSDLIKQLIQSELIEDPSDILANFILNHTPSLAADFQLFAAIYLLSHGVTKLLLAVGLLREQLWAFPSAMIVFTTFIFYQIYRYTHTHSVFLILLTVFDIFVVWLTWREYKYVKRRSKTKTN
ncbi:MAG: DUF2127 domain-containing protein [Candidatus Nomurabacteria bacterium]|nr:MAG: DUF2127 domain-containing protein [Candidatus Nomurabacteria bacterium]